MDAPAERHLVRRDAAQLKSCCAGLYEMPITSVLLGPSFHPGGPELTRRLAQAAFVGPKTRVLDVACGLGESGRVIAQRFGCQVVGLDLSATTLDRARTLTDQARLGHRIEYVQGDAEQLPFDADAFDVVLTECALCTFPDMATALQQMRRVLAPRGRIAISDIHLDAAIPDELDTVLGHVLCISGALSVAGYVDALRVAGFSGVHPRDATWALAEMIDGIEQRIDVARRLADAGELELPEGLEAPEPVLRAARAFVADRGVGYTLLTGRKPAA